ncbi:hypothetical protein [Paenibacillus lactis]|uniref:DUF4367 domain-containing protein n=1 Tax=Paenibacillus lactis 154 TaxID=743719 RepID=G4H9A4_9BACL|nr:hypothetical protein [Paenibacillus lactis]EHB68439.1 hypothetical protein PaelaDRAFT_0565 [Paenibacillus lactis 154]
MNLTKKTIIVAASFLLALSSASGYTAGAAAAPQKASKAQPASSKERLEQQKKEALAIHSKAKKPGELTVMYDGTDNTLSFSFYSITSTDYDDYSKLVSKYKAPALKQPEWLPEGYAFQSGDIVPPYYDSYSEPYQDMLKELKAEAKGKKYYAKKVKWSEAGGAALLFSRDSDIIRISAKKIYPFVTEITRVPGKGEKFERLSIEGVDALYATNSNALYSTKLTWEDPEKGLEYEISTYKTSPLTKEALVSIAESIISSKSQNP